MAYQGRVKTVDLRPNSDDQSPECNRIRERERDRQTDRQTERQTETEKQRDRGRETETKNERERERERERSERRKNETEGIQDSKRHIQQFRRSEIKKRPDRIAARRVAFSSYPAFRSIRVLSALSLS